MSDGDHEVWALEVGASGKQLQVVNIALIAYKPESIKIRGNGSTWLKYYWQGCKASRQPTDRMSSLHIDLQVMVNGKFLHSLVVEKTTANNKTFHVICGKK